MIHRNKANASNQSENLEVNPRVDYPLRITQERVRTVRMKTLKCRKLSPMAS